MSQLARIPVLVHAADPSVRSALRGTVLARSELRLVPDDGAVRDAVAVVGTTSVAACTDRLRADVCTTAGVVLLAEQLDPGGLVAAVRLGVRVVGRRADVDDAELVRLVVAARSHHGVLPPDLLGPLLARSAQDARDGRRRPSFTGREKDVLRLLADGLSTGEIAHELSYSERTIKGIVHDVTERFSLRNRSHAVAFAVREGVI